MTHRVDEEALQSFARALVCLRKEQGISQKRLEEISGVKQPIIARIERGASAPQLSTCIRLLRPLGYKLDIVPIEK